jgi:ribose transport system substrate-binding protein
MAHFRLLRKTFALVVVAALAVLVAACSSSSSSSATSASSSSSSTSSGSALASSSFPTLAQLFNGTNGVPPTSSPPPAKGKTIWWISCGQTAASCVYYANAGKAAAEAIGWKFHLADANLNIANGNATALEAAIAAHPSAIVEDAFSCSTVEPALEQAKADGIPVIGLETLDCSDVGGPKLFSVSMIYSKQIPTNKALWSAFGTYAADYIIASTDEHAKVLAAFGQGDPQFNLMNAAFKAQFAKCSGCSVLASLPWTPATLSPNGPWITSLRNALIKYPDATDVWVPFDTMAVENGGAEAVATSGSHAKMVSGLGIANALDYIRSGLISAEGYAQPSAWVSWAAIDELNRYFDGQPAVPEGIGLVAIDKNHNLPPAGQNYASNIPFEALYKKAWGVG